jgi:hypothetical protein
MKWGHLSAMSLQEEQAIESDRRHPLSFLTVDDLNQKADAVIRSVGTRL